jgi:hypothetical protein
MRFRKVWSGPLEYCGVFLEKTGIAFVLCRRCWKGCFCPFAASPSRSASRAFSSGRYPPPRCDHFILVSTGFTMGAKKSPHIFKGSAENSKQTPSTKAPPSLNLYSSRLGHTSPRDCGRVAAVSDRAKRHCAGTYSTKPASTESGPCNRSGTLDPSINGFRQ